MGDVDLNDVLHTDLASGTIVSILRTQASRCPDRCIYTFLADEEGGIADCTYQELDLRARSIAATLQGLCAPGERALLLYAPGLDYIAGFLGCLYAGVIAVPAYPPDPFRLTRTLPRLQSMVADAQATIALTTTPILNLGEMIFQMAPDLAALRWIATDTIPPDVAQAWRDPSVTPDSLAFLQYTSGSTGTPRGVMLSHANLLHNSRMIGRALALTPQSVAVLWLPPYHDMGLIGGILQPLLVGFHVVLMSPLSFLQQPYRWLKAVSDYKATIAGGPNFAYDLCVRKITPDDRSALDLSSWNVAFNGAEPVRHETLDRFAAYFAPCGFRRQAFQPCYGLAEATLFVSGGAQAGGPRYLSVSKTALAHNRVEIASQSDKDAQILVSCGHVQPDEEIVIVDPESCSRVQSNSIGEIWITGPSVARGYWQKPDETHETFDAHLADGRGPFLRTGDMGFLHDNQLYITGRIKDLIIIRGRNHYPQDIELTVERSHPALRPGCCAAFSIDVNGEERLAVVQEVDTRKNPDPRDIVQAIRRAVAEEHDLQLYAVALIKPHTIAKTSSGKIQRRTCRDEYLNGKLDLVEISTLESGEANATEASPPPQTLLQKALLALPAAERVQLIESHLRDKVARLLHVRPAQVDVSRSINALGIDSVVAVDLVSEIEDDLGVAMAMSTLMQGPTIRQLAEQIASGFAPTTSAGPAEQPVSDVREYPLSRGQRALWFLHQLAPHDPTYIIARAVRIPGELDISVLQRAFQDLIDRQPSLRTSIITRDGEPVQCVHNHVKVNFQEVDARSWRDADVDDRLLEAAYQPIDLSQESLLRVRVFTRSAHDHILLVAVHHIVADLWSLAVFISELGAFIAAEASGSTANLPPLKSQYTDHVLAEAQMLAGPEGERLWAFWQKQLGGELPVLNLVTDKPRPPIPSGLGAAESLVLGHELTRKIKALAQAHNATPFMVLLAAFQVLLHRYTGQDDILVGTPKAGRNHKMARVVGFFVNSVVMRANLEGNPTFAAFLERTRDTVRISLDHGDFPFALLVEKLQPTRDLSRSPIFQAMFAWQKTTRLVDNKGLSAFSLNEAGGAMPLGPLVMESLPLKNQVSPFDITLLVTDTDDEMAASLEYRLDLFEQATIRRMLDHFKVLLEGIVADPKRHISQLPLLTDVERRQILIEWNNTAVGQAETHCVHELVAQQAAHTPDATAIICDEGRITYRELNERANRLAHYLQTQGLVLGDVVALYCGRGLDAIVALLGLLKAGGTYMPLDPAYPSERLAFMLQDAHVRLVLTHKRLRDRLPETATRLPIVCLDDQAWLIEGDEHDPATLVSGDGIAYIIYTSGSTGQPKGVMVSHRVFANHCRDVQRHYGLQSTDRVLNLRHSISTHRWSRSFPP